MEARTCRKCGEAKPMAEFHRHRRSIGGRRWACRACRAKYQHENLDKVRVWCKRYYDNDPEACRIRKREWRRRNPQPQTDEVRARNRAQHARRRGRIKLGSCVVCGERKATEFHHADYSKPLEVVSICPEHHRSLHRGELCLLEIRESGDCKAYASVCNTTLTNRQ